jgi:hypothetical protein
MFSIITIASSTRKPTESVFAIIDNVSIEKSSSFMTPKLPSNDSGTATLGMIVAETLRRNMTMTRITRPMMRWEPRLAPVEVIKLSRKEQTNGMARDRIEAMKAIFMQRDGKSAREKAADVVRQFESRCRKAMEIFEAGVDDVLSYLHYPVSHWLRIRSTSLIEPLNREIRRRTRVVAFSPLRGLFTADWNAVD